MLAPLVTILVTIGALTHTTQARLPLFGELLDRFADAVPCLGPCLLANADYVMREFEKGENNILARCGMDFVRNVQTSQTFISTPGDANMKWLMVIGNAQTICPILTQVIRCYSGFVERTCGLGVRQIAEKYLTDLTKFVDCGVPSSERLYVTECLLPSRTNMLQFQVKIAAFQQCQYTALAMVNQNRWEDIYRNGLTNNFQQVCGVAEDLTRCYLELIRPAGGTLPKCLKAVSEVQRQLRGIKKFANCYGDGTGFLECLGNPDLYAHTGLSFVPCINSFNTSFVAAALEVEAIFGEPTSQTIKFVIKALAMRTCQSLPQFSQCITSTLLSNTACHREVVPLLRTLKYPTLQYINKLGNCPAQDLSALISCRCIVDYRVEKELIGTCTSGPSFYTVQFVIRDQSYGGNSFSSILYDIQPQIDSIYQQNFGYRFVSTSNYESTKRLDTFLVSFDLALQASVATTTTELKDIFRDHLESGKYLLGVSSTRYEVDSISVSVQQPRTNYFEKLSPKTKLIIGVVGGIVLLAIIVLICCCMWMFCQTRTKPVFIKRPMQPSISYVYAK